MDIETLLLSKKSKPKEKTETLSHWLISKKVTITQLLSVARTAKDPQKATCIEALESVSKKNPEFVNAAAFTFVTQSLLSKSPRVKWESARVIGNVVSHFADKLNEPIAHLLTNTEHQGTVVRWSSAYALGEIIKLNTRHNKELIPAIEAICKREEKNSIRKIYLEAIKKSGKK